MKKIYSIFASIYISATAFGQCLTTTVPTINANTGSCYNDYLIVNSNPISSNSGYQTTGNSYQYFPSPYINLQINSSYSFNLIGYTSSPCNIGMWIDFNGNQIFEQTEQVFLATNTISGTESFAVNVPIDAVIDTVKVRIIKQENAFGWGYGADDACNIISNGEIEEYEAIINCTNLNTVYYDNYQDICYQSTIPLYASVDFGDVSWYTNTNLAPVFTGNYFNLPISTTTTDTIVYVQNSYGTCFNGPKLPMNIHITHIPQVVIDSPDTVHSCTPYTFNATPGYDWYSWSDGNMDPSITINNFGGLLWVDASMAGCNSHDEVWVSIASDSVTSYAHVFVNSNFCTSHDLELFYDSTVSPGICKWYLLPSNNFIGTGSHLYYHANTVGNYQFMACINSICGVDTAYLSANYFPEASWDNLSFPNGIADINNVYHVCYNENNLQLVLSGLVGTVSNWNFSLDGNSWGQIYSEADTALIPSGYVSPGNQFYAYATLMNGNYCFTNTDTIVFEPNNTIPLNLQDNYYMCSFPDYYGIPAVDYGVYDLLWSTGDTTNSIFINTEGLYTLTTHDNVTGCTNYDHVYIHNGAVNNSIFPDVSYSCDLQPFFNFDGTNVNPIFWTEYNDSWGYINETSGPYYLFDYQGFNEYLVLEATVNGCNVIDTTFVDFSGNFTFSLGNDVTTNQSSYTINGPPNYQWYVWEPAGFPDVQSIAVTNSGDYYLTIYNLGCSYTDTINITFLPNNVQLNNVSDKISAFPNPASKNINFVSEKDFINEIKIFDLTGRVVFNKQLNGITNFSLDISKLPDGCYYTEATTNKGKSVNKIIITK